MEKIIINTDKAPKAIGPYSQAVRFQNLLFISGQLGINPQTNTLPDSLIEQTETALDNLEAILASVGLNTNHVLKTTIFLADMEDFPVVNELYANRFKTSHPARSTVEVAKLPKRAKFEIEAIAAYPD